MNKLKKPKLSAKSVVLYVLIVVALYIAALTIPYLRHKQVSSELKDSFRAENCFSPSTGGERAAFVRDNGDALQYRLSMMAQAQDEIIMSTFDFSPDEAGREVIAALMSAAERGVRVRLLVDGISGLLDMSGNPYFRALASTENVSVRIYNPVNLFKPWKLQARMHDKYIIVDDSLYLLGGRNTSNQFLGNYDSRKNVDNDLLVCSDGGEGSSLAQLRGYFERIWALPDCRDFSPGKETKRVSEARLELQSLASEPTAVYDWEAITLPTRKISLLSNPVEAENKAPELWYMLNELMHSGGQVTVYSPYVICDRDMYASLAETASMTEVDIITNSVSGGANIMGCADYLNQRKNILETGVTVYEYLAERSCHAKAVLVGDRMCITGSWNMDMRSTYQDTELMLAVDSEELCAVMRAQEQYDKSFSRSISQDGEYTDGENYVPRSVGFFKWLLYLLLRVVTIPIRSFL